MSFKENPVINSPFERHPRQGPRLDRENLRRARLRVAARAWLYAKARPHAERSPLVVEIVRFGGDADCIVIPGERQSRETRDPESQEKI